MRNLMGWTEQELKRIEREAYAILRGKRKKPGRTGNITLSKASKKYAGRVKTYKEKTGKKRISKSEREALHAYTPSQVIKHGERNEEFFERRRKMFEKRYGKNFSERYGSNPEVQEITRRMLEYVTPAKAAKILDIERDEPARPLPSPEPIPTPEPEWKKFREPDLPSIPWSDLPYKFKNSPHDDGFMYYHGNSFFWMGDSGLPLDFNELYEDVKNSTRGDGSGDYEFFRDYMNDLDSNILFDPGDTGKMFFVYRDEWESVIELDDDYTENRLYRDE